MEQEQKDKLTAMLRELIKKVEADEVLGVVFGAFLVNGRVNSGGVYVSTFEALGMLDWVKSKLIKDIEHD